MSEFTEELIAKLQAEINERQQVINQLRAKDKPAASQPAKKNVASWRKWSPERKRKFKATMKKKAEAKAKAA